MFSEIERIGERFGVRHEDIPAFITAIAEVFSRELIESQRQVEDWHGKARLTYG